MPTAPRFVKVVLTRHELVEIAALVAINILTNSVSSLAQIEATP